MIPLLATSDIDLLRTRGAQEVVPYGCASHAGVA